MIRSQTTSQRGTANAHMFLGTLNEAECCICEEESSNTHAPVITPACRHVFGSRFLRSWVLSDNRAHNRCPLCRAMLFDDALPGVGEDARPDSSANRVSEPAWAGERLFKGDGERPLAPHHPPQRPHGMARHGDLISPVAAQRRHEAQNQSEESIRGVAHDCQPARAQGPLPIALRDYLS